MGTNVLKAKAMKLHLAIAILLGTSHGVQNVECFLISGKRKSRRANKGYFLNMPPVSSDDAGPTNGDGKYRHILVVFLVKRSDRLT